MYLIPCLQLELVVLASEFLSNFEQVAFQLEVQLI